MMKIMFNVEESLKQCPPKYVEVNHERRVVLRRDKVTYRSKEQSRVLTIVPKDVLQIRDSFEALGWLHDQPVPTIKRDPDNKDRYIGISGFNRDEAASLLGWDTTVSYTHLTLPTNREV